MPRALQSQHRAQTNRSKRGKLQALPSAARGRRGRAARQRGPPARGRGSRRCVELGNRELGDVLRHGAALALPAALPRGRRAAGAAACHARACTRQPGTRACKASSRACKRAHAAFHLAARRRDRRVRGRPGRRVCGRPGRAGLVRAQATVRRTGADTARSWAMARGRGRWRIPSRDCAAAALRCAPAPCPAGRSAPSCEPNYTPHSFTAESGGAALASFIGAMSILRVPKEALIMVGHSRRQRVARVAGEARAQLKATHTLGVEATRQYSLQ